MNNISVSFLRENISIRLGASMGGKRGKGNEMIWGMNRKGFAGIYK